MTELNDIIRLGEILVSKAKVTINPFRGRSLIDTFSESEKFLAWHCHFCHRDFDEPKDDACPYCEHRGIEKFDG